MVAWRFSLWPFKEYLYLPTIYLCLTIINKKIHNTFKKMRNKNPKDQLFYQLLCELSDDIVDDTQSAADRTIDLSSQFIGEKNQHLVEDFRSLCAGEESDDATEQLKIVQQNMKQVADKNTAIRAEVNVLLGAMQFSEFLRQHLTGLRFTFEAMMNFDAQSVDGNDTEALRLAMQKQMHTFDERQAFHEHVMHEQMPEEDQEVSQDLIDQLIG